MLITESRGKKVKNKYSTVINNVFFRNFLSYIMVFIVPMIAIGVIVSTISSGIIINQSKKNFSKNIAEKRSVIDSRLEKLDKMAIQLSQTPWMNKLMNMYPDIRYDEYDYSDFENMRTELKNYLGLNNDIIDVAIYLKNDNVVLHPGGLEKIDDYFQYAIVDGEGIIKNKIKEQNKSSLYYGYDNITYYSRDSEFMTYMQSMPLNDIRSKATLMIIIDKNIFDNHINNDNTTYNSQTFILNKNNKLVIGENEKKYDRFLDYDMYQKKTGVVRDKIDGKDTFIFYERSNIKPWINLMFVPVRPVITDVVYFRKLMYYIIIICLFIGVLMSYLLAKANYTPIKNLKLMLQRYFNEQESVGKTGSDDSDYEVIEKIINNIIISKEDMEYERRKNNLILRNAYLNRLMLGKDEKTEKNVLDKLDIKFEFSNFMVVMLSPHQDKEKNTDMNINEYTAEAVRTTADKTINSAKNKIYVFNSIEQNIIVLLNTEYDKSFVDEVIIPLLDNIKISLENSYNITFYAGIGNIYKDVNFINNSYDEAYDAIHYAIMTDKKKIMNYSNIADYQKNVYFYPIEKEIELINSLKVGKYKKVKEILDEVIQKNITDRKLSIYMIRCLFYELEATMIKAIDEISEEDHKYFDHKNLSKINTMHELFDYIDGIYKQICKSLNQDKSEEIINFKRKVTKYVNSNYMKNNMSLNLLSNIFGYSEPYISRIFKEYVGINYYDYVNYKRIQKSKELLLETNKTIHEISGKIGYTNDKVFRRVFKKYVCMTPIDYRKKEEGRKAN